MSMVTPMLTQLLKVYASRFVESGSLRAESGDIYGDDLFLNCSVIEETIGEAIDQVELGVHINLIHCKRLKLEIPWSLLSFSNDVLELTIEEVTVVLAQQDPRQVSAEELRELKEARVREAMAQLLESVLLPAGAARESSKEKDGGEPSGYLLAIIRKVLRRCRPKIRIERVHVRYEHRGTEGAVSPFSLGVALGRLSLDLADGTAADAKRACWPRLGRRPASLPSGSRGSARSH